MIDTKQIATQILEEYANYYSEVDAKHLAEHLNQLKAEAYKEFAERLKEKNRGKTSGCVGWIDFDDIDNLLKELVGENI